MPEKAHSSVPVEGTGAPEVTKAEVLFAPDPGAPDLAVAKSFTSVQELQSQLSVLATFGGVSPP